MADHDDVNAPYANLTPAQRTRVIVRATGRMLLSIVAIVIMYIIVPPGDLVEGTPGLGMAIGIALVVGVIALQLMRTMRDPYPEVRAATSLMVLVTMLVAVFALTYASLCIANPGSFTEVLDKSDAIYFTVTTLSTTGFGDIAAVSPTARWVVTIQMLFDLVVLVGLARVFVLAAKTARARRSKGTPD